MPSSAARYLEGLFHAAEEDNRRVILATLTPRPGATLLDLGCGDGTLSVRAGERIGATRVLGVEYAPRLAQGARDRGVDVTESDLAQPLPHPDGAIDVVLSNQVIEHLNDTDRFVAEIARVLTPGGYAVLSTNNLASWHNIVSLVLGWQPMPCHVSDQVMVGNPASFAEGPMGSQYQMHRRIFTGRALAELAAHHGLEAQVQSAAGYYPLPPRLARAAARLDPRHAAFLVHRYGRSDPS